MARTITEIKKDITDVFMSNETVQALYGINVARSFEEQFSKVSLESILFHVIATCIWTLEKLFDHHREEMTRLVRELKPHSARWYVNMAKAYRDGYALVPDTDKYDDTGLAEEEIRKSQVVKYAAVVEKEDLVCVKVAAGEEGNRHPLTADQVAGLTAYLREVKDAGVKLSVINELPNAFDLDIDVYYNPQVFDQELRYKNTGEQVVHNRIASFVENLPFNGEYRNSALIAALLQLEGIELVELKEARIDGIPIPAKCIPEYGYFKVDKETLGINAIAYETV